MLLVLTITRSATAQSLPNYTYPHSVRYVGLDDGGVSAKLAAASTYLKALDDNCPEVGDVRACVDLTVSSTALNPSLPPDITNSAQLAAAFASPGNIKVVASITYCDGDGTSIAGCAAVGQRNMIVTRGASATVLAHEAGHNQGICGSCHAACFKQIMYYSDNGGKALNFLDVPYYSTPLAGYPYVNGTPCFVGIPDVQHSYFVPQSGTVGGAQQKEGTEAVQNFRACPNNDGGTSLPSNARIKVVLRDSNGNPVPGVGAWDIFVQFNGGTPAQNFSGLGADSIIANSQFNSNPHCPDVRNVNADGATDANGVTYITFTGSSGTPGVGARDLNRKWGHYDTEIPVYANGVKLVGRFRSTDENGTYVLQIKSCDLTGGLGTLMNVGESVTAADFSSIANNIGDTGPLSYWRDLDSSGSVAPADFSIMVQHVTHDCNSPTNP